MCRFFLETWIPVTTLCLHHKPSASAHTVSVFPELRNSSNLVALGVYGLSLESLPFNPGNSHLNPCDYWYSQHPCLNEISLAIEKLSIDESSWLEKDPIFPFHCSMKFITLKQSHSHSALEHGLILGGITLLCHTRQIPLPEQFSKWNFARFRDQA